MHPLLKQMGRDIVKNESLKDPGKRQFLWDTKDISELLEDEDTGTGKEVVGIKLQTILSWREDFKISKSSFHGMKNLQFLLVNFSNVRIPEGLSCLPNKLRLLEWPRCSLTFLPSKFSGKFLVELIMEDSKLEKLWDEIKPLQRLKRMVLSKSRYLKEIPDLSNATSLEELDLNECKGLLELTSTIGYATKLKRCILSHCYLLKELPSSMGRLINLEELDLSECKGLLELTSTIGYATKLKRCILSGCVLLKELPSSMGWLINLEVLDLYKCEGLLDLTSTIGNATMLLRCKLSRCVLLKKLPSSMGWLINLEVLDLSECRGLVELTSTIGNATKLKRCKLSYCYLLKELPSSMGRLINLEELNLYQCTGLKELSGCSSLEKLTGCSSLKTLDLRETPIWEVPSSIRYNWSCLSRLDMSGCRNIKEFPNVPDSIEKLVLCKTRIEEIPPWIENLSRLRELVMYGCEKLKKISPNISRLENLRLLGLRKRGDSEYGYLDYEHDFKLFEAVIRWEGPDSKHRWTLLSDFKVHYILPRCLPATNAVLSFCLKSSGLNTIPDCIRSLSGLTKLDVSKCRMLEALPPLPDSLLSIDAEGCDSLKRIDSSFHNPNIYLNFAGCLSLNQKARKLIHTSVCKYALLPGAEVPAHFPHQATLGSLTINLTPRPLCSSLRFKACILLSNDDILVKEEILKGGVSCHVMGKQNGLTIQYGSNQHHMKCRYGGYGDHQYNFSKKKEDHLYIFEDYFHLNQDCAEAEDATLSELVFEFIGHGANWKVKGCGVRLLFPDSVIDENAADNDGDEDESDDDDDEVDSEDDGDEVDSEDDGESTLIRGVKVPAHFTYRATSHSLKINQTPQPLPPSLRFKACILLSRGKNLGDVFWRIKDFFDVEGDKLVMLVSCTFRGKQNDLIVQYGSNQRDLPGLYGWDDCLYTFEDSFTLGKDCPEAKEAIFSELVFEFKVFYKKWKVEACGVQLLEDKEESGRDEGEENEVGDDENDGVEEDIKDDADKTQGEEPRQELMMERQEARNEGGSALSTYMKLSCCYIL